MRIVSFCMVCLGIWVACSAASCEAPPLPNGSAYQSVTLTHEGFDFSEGAVGSSFDDNDGHTTNWPAHPAINVEKEYSTYVWFEPFSNSDTQNFTKDMGAVALSSVVNVPTEWDAGAGLTLEPLQVGHVYVVKCRDGYAKFLVKAIDPADHVWAVDIDYAFTTDSTFDE